MKRKILSLKNKMSLYDIALDIGISESSLYCYINNYRKVGPKTVDKIREYLKTRGRRSNESKSNR